MRPASEWRSELAALPSDPSVELVEGRNGLPTVRVGNVSLHSRYNPREEAARLVDSAQLDPARPVLVIGLGLGYPMRELQERGYEVAAVEPNPAVAALALGDRRLAIVDWRLNAFAEGQSEGNAFSRESEIENRRSPETLTPGPPPRGRGEEEAAASFLLGVGDADSIAATEAFGEFAAKLPQVLVHPPTARIQPGYVEAVQRHLARKALGARRLSIAVVGPMFGGSLPITDYVVRAFENLGHRVLHAGNAIGYDLHEAMTRSLQSPTAKRELSTMLTQFLNEWTYARVVEFAPEICLVIAQAPVSPTFPQRLRDRGIVSAFWFMENWRHLGYWRDIAPHYDCFFHIQPGEFERQLDEIGCAHHAFVQTACDPSVHRPVELTDEERAEFGCDVSFAGAGYANRQQVFAGLTDFDLKLWGVNWTARELQAHVCRPEERFTPELFAKIVAASEINLNLHSSTSHPGIDPNSDAINPRVFEIAACGGFQLCDPCIGLERYFEFEAELPVYRDLAELRAKIRHYLDHPEEREAIAKRARERVLREHTYEHRARQMLDFIIEAQGPRMLKKGVRVQRTMAEMADRVGRETELGRYLASLPPDTIFTHEAINEALDQAEGTPSRPEAIFAYLRDMRASAEALIGDREFAPGA